MPLLPQGSALKVDAPLTNISIAFQQQAQNYIAGQIFPVIPVQRQGDLYFKYNKGDWFRTIAGLRAPATESVGGGWNVETDSYYADVYAVHKDVDDQTRANADSMFNLDRDATLWVTQNLLLKRDQLWVSNYFTSSVWTGGTGVGGGGNGADLVGAAAAGSNQLIQWDRSGSTPIEDIRKQRTGMGRASGYMPNVLVLGPDVYDALLDHPDIIDRIKYTQQGTVSNQLLATLFGVDRVVVVNSIQNTGPMGGTDSFSFLAGKHALLVYANPTPGLMVPSAGYIFAWSGLLGGGAYSSRIKRFRMEPIASDRIEGEMSFDQKIVSNELGVFFSGIVQ